MGAKSSKSVEPKEQRRRSFSNIGRSSQRMLFQKLKIELHAINKKLEKPDTTTYEAFKYHLEIIRKNLDATNPHLKNKNKKSYDEIIRYLEDTENKLNRHAGTRNSFPMGKDAFLQELETRIEKNVGKERRSIAVVEPERKFSEMDAIRPASTPIGDISRPWSPIEGANRRNWRVIPELHEEDEEEKTFHELDALKKITKAVDQLEEKLKYFTGKKNSDGYVFLQEGLVQNLIKLNDINISDDAALSREKSIANKRILELIEILKLIGGQERGSRYIDSEDDESSVEEGMRVLTDCDYNNGVAKTVVSTTI